MFFTKKIGGFIKYFDLVDWWQKDLEESDRSEIYKLLPNGKFNDLAINRQNLDKGEIISISISHIFFLSNLLGYIALDNTNLRNKILHKIESYPKEIGTILDFHFLYSTLLQASYKKRDHEIYLQKAIEYCIKQIEISDLAKRGFIKQYPKSNLPSHAGFKQLIIIYEKNRNFKEALELCVKAINQGWAGDWDKRIEKYNQKEKNNG